MELLSLIFLISISFSSINALSEESNIELHMECPDESYYDCYELPFISKDEKIKLIKINEMVITPENFQLVEYYNRKNADQGVILRLDKPSSYDFSEMTRTGKGKTVAFVINDKVLFKMKNDSEFTEGNIFLSPTEPHEKKFLDHVPWLRKMADETKEVQRNEDTPFVLIYASLALFILGGSIYFSFFKKYKISLLGDKDVIL